MTVSVALVGYGLAGRVLHAPLVQATPGLALRYVVTADAGRSAQARSDLPEATVVPDVDALWRQASDVGLVVVAAANVAHVPVATAAVERGLAVVVDKPLAVTAAAARALVEQAAQRGVLLTVFQNRRWDSDTLTVQRLLAAGVLGPVVRFESRFERYQPVPRSRWRESADPALGGGLLLDLGSHLVDAAVLLFGPVRSVHGELSVARRGGQADDEVFVSLEHAGGVRSQLWASSVAAAPAPRVRVLGLDGGYEKDDLDGQEAALRAGRRPGEPGWGAEPAGRLYTADGVRGLDSVPGAWPDFYAGVARSLAEATPAPVDPWDAVRTLEVLEAVRASAASGAVVRLG